MVYVEEDKYPDVTPGRYLVDDDGQAVYRIDVPIKREAEKMDNGRERADGVQGTAAATVRHHHRGHSRRQARMGLVIIRRADRDRAGTDGRLGAAGRRRHVSALEHGDADLRRRIAPLADATRRGVSAPRPRRKPAPACSSPAATSPAARCAACSSGFWLWALGEVHGAPGRSDRQAELRGTMVRKGLGRMPSTANCRRLRLSGCRRRSCS